MTWPDTYKDRYEAAQRTLRILREALTDPEVIDRIAPKLAEDPEAAAELVAAFGQVDEFKALLDAEKAKAPVTEG